MNLQLVRSSKLTWILLWCAIAGIGIAVAIAQQEKVTDQQPLPVVEGIDQAELDGVAVNVVSVELFETRTVVVISLNADDSAGAHGALTGPAVLVVGDETYRLRSALTEGRRLTLEFPPLAEELESSPLKLMLGGVSLNHVEPGLVEDLSSRGVYRIEVSAERVSEQPPAWRQALKLEESFGPGTIALSDIVVDGSTTVVRGTLNGYTTEQADVVEILPVVLVDSEGQEHHAISASLLTATAAPARMEFTFATPASGPAVLELTLNARQDVPNNALLNEWTGSEARFDIAIP